MLASLRVVARVRGISEIAQTGMTRRGLQKALSSNGNPRLENVNSIMKALGYCLTPQKIMPPAAEFWTNLEAKYQVHLVASQKT
ncbi:helix-turn-helix domain-containing transcriptional regulator [Nostoc sp.]|uniref:helix-turn-helix domain-containing transcriptional regulator n=1 Tax=Nostoc sp. TaxID=1180 RepID=UPI002FF87859